MLKQYIKNDLKSNPITFFIITCSITIAVLLAILSGILTTQLFGSMNQFMETAQTPHLLQMHSGDINRQEIEGFSTENTSISKYQIMEFINIEGVMWELGDTTLNHGVQDNGLSIQSTEFDYLLNQENEIIHPNEGELYVPITYRAEGSVDIGSEAKVAGVPLIIAGFLRDSQMNSTLASSKRFIVHEKDFEKIAPKGRMEYLIEFQVNDLNELSSVQNAYQREGLPNNGPMITHRLFQMINALTEGMTIALILLIALTVVLISFLLIRLTLLTQLEDDFNQIGILKAIGFRNRDIKKLYAQKYIWITFAAGIFGFLLALLVAPRLQKNIELYMGTYDGRVLMYLVGIVGGCMIMGAVIAYVYWTLRKTKEISAAAATKAGFMMKKKGRSSTISIAKHSKISANLMLAFNQMRIRVNLFVTLALVIIFSLFILIVPYNLNHTLHSSGFMRYMGIGESEIIFNIQQVDNVEELVDEMVDDLETNPLIKEFALNQVSNFQLADGHFINVTLGDHETFPVEYTKGSRPSKADELALSVMNADELEKEIGDKITLLIDGEEKTLSIQGIYSDITNGGKTAKAIFEPEQTQVMSAMIYADLSADTNRQEVVQDYLARYPQIKIAETSEYLNQMYASTTESIGVISFWGGLVSLFIVSLITILTLRLIIARSEKEINTMSILGFRISDLKAQLLWQMGIISMIGILIGLIFSNTAGETLSGLLLSSLGGSGFRFIIQPLVSYIAIPLFFFATILLTNAIVLNRSFMKGAE